MSDERKPSPPDGEDPMLGLDSVAIKRLVEEVRQDKEAPSPGRYNRIYNRHNR
jgi:hypothetical protein